jgi:hypothetical protein
MPVQINEIIVRVNVEPQQQETAASSPLEDSSGDNCRSCEAESMAEKILHIIREKNER